MRNRHDCDANGHRISAAPRMPQWMTRMALYVAMAAAMAPAVVSAGKFVDISNDKTPSGQTWIVYTGEVVPSDVRKYKALLRREDHIVLVIDSPGGSFYAGIELGRLTQENSDKVTIRFDKAYSAAALWALGDDEPDFLTDDSELGLHLPYVDGRLGEGEAQKLGYEFGKYIDDVLGSGADKVMDALGEMRDKCGKTALLVFRKGKEPFIRE